MISAEVTELRNKKTLICWRRKMEKRRINRRKGEGKEGKEKFRRNNHVEALAV